MSMAKFEPCDLQKLLENLCFWNIALVEDALTNLEKKCV